MDLILAGVLLTDVQLVELPGDMIGRTRVGVPCRVEVACTGGDIADRRAGSCG